MKLANNNDPINSHHNATTGKKRPLQLLLVDFKARQGDFQRG